MGEMADFLIEQHEVPWDGLGYSPNEQMCMQGCIYYNENWEKPPFTEWCKIGQDPDTCTRFKRKTKLRR